jgi:hypothetical protein
MLTQLSSDIHGTKVERQYFHRFRLEALKGLAIHSENLGLFWERLVPQVAHQDDAVKHALVALGSAYQLKGQGHKSLQGVDRTQLEVFTIQQYNKAIKSLQQQAAPQSHEHVERTLVCCLIFICLEFMRQNRPGAITHIASGLRIIETLPASLFEYVLSDTMSDPQGYGKRMSRAEMRQLFAFFQYIEFSSVVYGAPIKPALALRQHQTRQASGVPAERSTQKPLSISEYHDAAFHYGHYVFAWACEALFHQGDMVFWSSPEHIRRHQEVLDRGHETSQKIDQFMAGPTAPRPDTDRLGYLSVILDRMMFRGVFFIAQCLPLNLTRRDMRQFEWKYREFLELCEEVVEFNEAFDVKGKAGTGENGPGKSPLTLDNGALIGLHITLNGTGNPETRRRTLNILRRIGDRCEGIYEASEMLRVYTAFGMYEEGSVELEQLLDEPVGPTLSGLGGLPALEAKLAALSMGTKSESN